MLDVLTTVPAEFLITRSFVVLAEPVPVALNSPQNSAEVSPKMLGVVNFLPSLVRAAAV